jgi:hypothetical protein
MISSKASSFYKAAFEESKLMEAATRLNIPLPVPSEPLKAAGAPVVASHIASPAHASSFYKKALEESQMMENGGNTNGTLKMPPPSAMAGEESAGRAPNDDNLYDSLMRYHQEHDDVDGNVPGIRHQHMASLPGIDEDDQKPAASPTGDVGSFYRSALSPVLGTPGHSEGGGGPFYGDSAVVNHPQQLSRPEVASSFYRAALEATGQGPGHLEATGGPAYADAGPPMDSTPPASNNDSNHRRGNRQEVSPSSFYRAAILAAESAPSKPATKPGVVMVDEPVVRPDSAMYRAAQGNRNARYDHYS